MLTACLTTVFLIEPHQLMREAINISLDDHPAITVIGEATEGYGVLTILPEIVTFH